MDVKSPSLAAFEKSVYVSPIFCVTLKAGISKHKKFGKYSFSHNGYKTCSKESFSRKVFNIQKPVLERQSNTSLFKFKNKLVQRPNVEITVMDDANDSNMRFTLRQGFPLPIR